MTRARRLAPFFVALVVVAAVVTLAATRDRLGTPAPEPRAAVTARALLRPRVSLFGSAMRAEVRVRVDPKRVDPRRVRVTVPLEPLTALAPARIQRQGSGGRTLVRITYRVHCVLAACSRPGGQATVTLRPAVVRWGAHRLAVPWEPATIASRVTAGDLAHPTLRYATDVPARAYRIDPVVVGWTSIGAAAALVLALGIFAPVKVRRDERPDEPQRSDIDSALDRVVASADGSQADRRSAIGDLALVLEREGFGELAPLARRIAWSSGGPSRQVTSELALLVRAALEVAT